MDEQRAALKARLMAKAEAAIDKMLVDERVGEAMTMPCRRASGTPLKPSVLTAPSRHEQRHAPPSSSTSKSGTTVSGGTRPWAISALPNSSTVPASDILSVR